MQFSADFVKINGPLIDGSFKITFTVGEYEYDHIKDLPCLNGKIMVVTVRDDETQQTTTKKRGAKKESS